MSEITSSAVLSEPEIRQQHLQALRDMGINPYPSTAFPITAYADQILNADWGDVEGRHVACAGRISPFRIMGKVGFFHLTDESGRIQVYVKRDVVGDEFYNEVFKKLLDPGDIVGVIGTVFRTKTGEVTIDAGQLTLLSKAVRSFPIEKEKDGEVFNEITDKEFRYRQRYVDLAVHSDIRDIFHTRAHLLRNLRNYFQDHLGAVEVETPLLQPLYGGASARPFTTHHNALDMELFLRIAPELYLKRLLVGGFDAVFEIGKNFRNEGLSPHHNPEFTMLEAYFAYRDCDWLVDSVEELYNAFTTLDEEPAPFYRLEFYKALNDATDADWEVLDEAQTLALAAKLNLQACTNRTEALERAFNTFVEPHIGEGPVFVIDHPVELSPLAKPMASRPTVAERFEFYVNGVEIANGFSELNDPALQLSRFEAQRGSEPVDLDYIRALEYGMPPAAGLGIGIDRLLMSILKIDNIREVILFPLLRPEQQ